MESHVCIFIKFGVFFIGLLYSHTIVDENILLLLRYCFVCAAMVSHVMII